MTPPCRCRSAGRGVGRGNATNGDGGRASDVHRAQRGPRPAGRCTRARAQPRASLEFRAIVFDDPGLLSPTFGEATMQAIAAHAAEAAAARGPAGMREDMAAAYSKGRRVVWCARPTERRALHTPRKHELRPRRGTSQCLSCASAHGRRPSPARRGASTLHCRNRGMRRCACQQGPRRLPAVRPTCPPNRAHVWQGVGLLVLGALELRRRKRRARCPRPWAQSMGGSRPRGHGSTARPCVPSRALREPAISSRRVVPEAASRALRGRRAARV